MSERSILELLSLLVTALAITLTLQNLDLIPTIIDFCRPEVAIGVVITLFATFYLIFKGGKES